MSRFVFNENTLFIYLFVYLPQRKLDQGSIKGGEAKRRKQSSQQGTTLSQQLTNQGGEGLIRRCFSPGSWTRSPLLLPHECLREAQLQWGNSSGEQPNSSAAHVTCLPGKGSLPFPVKLHLALVAGGSAHHVKEHQPRLEPRAVSLPVAWGLVSTPAAHLVSKEAY